LLGTDSIDFRKTWCWGYIFSLIYKKVLSVWISADNYLLGKVAKAGLSSFEIGCHLVVPIPMNLFTYLPSFNTTMKAHGFR